ncbi:cytochrome c-type biogenesis protein CcmH [Falsihalocynthiibacter sp. SS001]|uniref:cytochrome c-type biogenesis protein n=1 Tax=Falsihalocynthiibacter sp. SS001 TaxID=3349698 RepID=UPI0036D3D93C
MKTFLTAFMLWISLAVSAVAVEPNEMLDDPVLEERAREISKGLRCMQCQNETIDESNADIARDLRLAVRERLVAGDTDEETVAYIVDRYGEFALLKPTVGGANLVLWLAGPLMLLLALAVGVAFVRRSSKSDSAATQAELSREEQDRLDDILDN